MADSTPNIDTITNTMAGIEDRVNEYHDAVSPGSYFGRHATACEGLTWGYYGGIGLSAGAATRVSNGTLTLTASTTCYIEHTLAGVVSFNTSGFTAGRVPDYVAVTGTDSVSSYSDVRGLYVKPTVLATGASHTVDDVITLLQALGLCKQS